MVCDYTYDENSQKIRINCLGCLYGSSIEDYPMCMAAVIDKIMEVKKVKSVVLAREREYEYGPDQVAILKEIAELIEDILREGILPIEATEKSNEYSKWSSKLQYIILDLLRKDPIAAYIEILREIRRIRIKSKVSGVDYKYYEDRLEGLRSKLEGTKIIEMGRPFIKKYKFGDRVAYRQLFSPVVRPNFMLTRFMITPPKNAISIDRYKIEGGIQVEIYKFLNTTQLFYFIKPPEFQLSDQEYTVLDEARRYMAIHRPKEAEFVKTEKVRELFYSIGKDIIRDTADKMGTHLSADKVEELANILTRYTAGMGVMELLLKDSKIQDIYVNSPVETQPILIFHQDWEECKTNLIPTREDAEVWATRLRIQSGRPLDEANPVLDTNIDVPGGSARFAIITKSLSPYGLAFAVRRHRDSPWTLPLFIKAKMINPLSAGLLSFLVDGSVSFLIAGGRSSGKTSLLGALMLELMPKIRICTLEDTLELPVKQLMNLNFNIQSLKSRSVITRVETEMPAEEALRTALRLGDSAMILGEIRSKEAKALYEAMRIGALSNIVAGTVHGESPYGVYDRVVNDLGVPPTSFKATDIIAVCKMMRDASGMHRFRRMIDITEVRKEWTEDPVKESGFVSLMEYSGKIDALKGSDTFVNGESEVLNRIAGHIKEYAGNWDAVWENIKLRARMKEAVINISDKLNKPELLEADWVVRSNQKFHLILEDVKEEIGHSDPERVYHEWEKWFKNSIQVKK
ncbi:MAG: type II/IV secretion system ATPase subunit [Candidatus Aenigmarchaeota archaeon]|nr:type II/IV secretion system ATPase subunit [Candidatus Aenigmarchaeota archaeon]